jgi:hypothetical protein
MVCARNRLLGLGIGLKGRGQIALLAGLQAHLIEVGITQAAKQACPSGLGHVGHGSQLCGRLAYGR